MDLPPFLLDRWLAHYEFKNLPVRHNLATSTGPHWTIEELQALPIGTLKITETPLTYAPPDGSRALKAAIADYLDVEPEWIIVTTGASEALSILFCLASAPSANVVLPVPSFPSFAALAGAWQLGVNAYRLDPAERFRLSSEMLVEATDERTVLALVNSPHNPTGAVLDREQVERVAAALTEKNVPLIADEAYHPLYFDTPRKSAAGLDNVIVVGDLSKALSLAGARIGWIVDRNEDRRRRIVDARSYFTISSSPVMEDIAVHALLNRGAILKRLHAVAKCNLDILTSMMVSLKGVLDWERPAGGTTCFPWFGDGRDSRDFCELLAQRDVLVVPGDCFGAPSHIRLSFGAQRQGFQSAMEILAATLRS